MSQTASLRIKGLHTFVNDISEVPDGALVVADNIVIDRDSIAEPLRGFDYLRRQGGYQTFFASGYCQKIFFYQGYPHFHYNDAELYYPEYSIGAVDLGALVSPTEAPTIKTNEQNDNLYLTSNNGVLKMDTYSTPPYHVGAPPGLDLVTSSAVASIPQAVLNNTAVSYRIIFGKYDNNNLLVVGAPSQIASFTNTSGSTTAVTLTYTAPSTISLVTQYVFVLNAVNAPAISLYATYTNNGQTFTVVSTQDLPSNNLLYCIGTGAPAASGNLTISSGGGTTVISFSSVSTRSVSNYFAQIYRSDAVANTVTPPDEQKLIATVTTVSPGTNTYVDNIPPGFGGALLYTAASQQGIQNSYVPPPLCVDICTFSGCQFYIRPTYRWSISISLTKIMLDTLGLHSGDTFTISNGVTARTYTAGAGSWVFTDTSAHSPAQAIALTAQSLVSAINTDALSVWFAYYDSGLNDLPGQIRIEAKDYIYPQFYITSSRATCWSNPLMGGKVLSSQDNFPNGVAYSLPQEPESVPLPNQFKAGGGNKELYRGIPLRDSLFLLKEDGVYRIYGTDPSNFQLALLDSSCNIIAPDTAKVLGNVIYALTTQGIVSISETGVTIVSRPIESDILKIITTNPNVDDIAFGFSYESQRSYYICLPSVATDTVCTQFYRYNVLTSAWTRGTLALSSGAVDPKSDVLLLGPNNEQYILVERKNLDYTDYANYSVTGNFTNYVIDGTINMTPLPNIGDVLYQNSNAWGIVSSYKNSRPVVASPAINLTPTTFAYTAVDLTNNWIKIATPWVYPQGTAVKFTTTGTLPSGLSTATTYYVSLYWGNTYPSTATGFYAIQLKDGIGNVITLGTHGTGNHTTTAVNPTSFVSGNIDILNPIYTAMTWAPQTLGSAVSMKQIREAQFLFRLDVYGEAQIGFATDLQPQEEFETFYGVNYGGYGIPAYGGPNENVNGAIYGGGNRRRTLRVGVTRNHQRCQTMALSFNQSWGYSQWLLEGITLIGTGISERTWMDGNSTSN